MREPNLSQPVSVNDTDWDLDHYRGLGRRAMVDTSEGVPVYLLMGENRAYIRLSPSAYQLLQWRDEGLSFCEIVGRLRDQGQEASEEDVRIAYRHVAEKVLTIERKERPMGKGFLFLLPIMRERLVKNVAQRLAVAFNPFIAGGALLVALATLLLVLRGHAPLTLTPAYFWQAYLLLLLSLVAHEFGHASACTRFGAQPSDIGFTVYLIYPAFYSDVSAAWQLNRWQRVVVDLGGMYFQLIVGTVYAFAYLIWGLEPLRVAVVMILGTCLFSLNPIFRFDGYWVVADSLGVTNLGQQPNRILTYLYNRLRRRPTVPLPWSRTIIFALIPYTFASFAFWGYFIWRFVPSIWRLLRAYPQLLSDFAHSSMAFPGMMHRQQLPALLMSTFMLVFSLLVIFRLLSPLVLSVQSVVHQWREKREASSVAL